MAENKKINVEITGNARGVKNAASQANKSLGGLEKQAQKLGGVLAGAFAGTALIAGLGKAINKIAEFEATMRRVALISKGSEQALSSLAKQLGASTSFTAKEAGDAMTFLAQAGFNANQIMAATPGILELAGSTMIDLASAADIASNVLSAYGMQASQINEINDLLVNTTNNANTNVLQFAEAFKIAGPIARGAGVDIKELSTLIGVLGNAGIQGSLAGTQLKTAIAQLISPVGEAKQALADLGVSVTDANGELRPMMDIFRDLGAAGMTAEQAFAIFQQRAASGALVMADSALAAEKLRAKLEESDSAAKQYAAQMDTLKGDIDTLSAAWEALVLEGSAFNKQLRESIQGLTTFINIISGGTGATKSISDLETEIAKLSKQRAETDLISDIFGSGPTVRELSNEIDFLTEKLSKLREEAVKVAEEDDFWEKLKKTREAGIAAKQAVREQTIALAAYRDLVKRTGIETETAFGIEDQDIKIKEHKVTLLERLTEKQKALNEAVAKGNEWLDKQMSSEQGLVSMFADKAISLETATAGILALREEEKQLNIAQVTLNKATGDYTKGIFEAAAATAALAIANGQSAKSIIAAALAVAVAEAIKDSMFAAKNPIVGLLLAGASVAAVKVLFDAIPAFATGTSFAPGGMALVGERGPEVVNLPRSASVTPNHMIGGGGGGDIVLQINEYEFARIVGVSSANQGNNIARTTF